MTDIDKLVAIEKTHGVELNFLGHLIWFTVTDCRITREQLQGIFTEARIGQDYMPKEICPRDAFRRATKAGEVKKAPYGDNRYLNLMVRDVRADKENIIRQLVREVVDGKETRLEYLPVANLILLNDDVHVVQIADMNPEEKAAAERIEQAYEKEKANYNGRTMRDIVMDIIRGCRPVSVRPSGGVYFIPKEYEDNVRSLQKFAEKITDYSITGYKSRVYRVPVVNAKEQKQMLEESLEEQVKSEAGAMIEEMARLVKSDKNVTQYLANQYVERARALAKTVKGYEEMLSTEITMAQADLELVMAQAMAVLDKVEAV